MLAFWENIIWLLTIWIVLTAHIECYLHNISVNVTFDFLQVYHRHVRSNQYDNGFITVKLKYSSV